MTGAGGQVHRFGTVVVIGGGCYGSYYVRQLRRAREAGRAAWDRLLVIDREAECAAALAIRRDPAGVTDLHAADEWRGIDVVTDEWSRFIDGWLTRSLEAGTGELDAIVPSPLMPHLLAAWIRTVAGRAIGAPLESVPVAPVAGVPWQREGPDGTRYASFATWTCPINCIEPERCPHTKGPRDWSLPRTLAAQGGGVAVPVTHRTFGVGMIDVPDVLAAARGAREALARGEAAWIATSSHCHAAITSLRRAGAAPLSR